MTTVRLLWIMCGTSILRVLDYSFEGEWYAAAFHVLLAVSFGIAARHFEDEVFDRLKAGIMAAIQEVMS